MNNKVLFIAICAVVALSSFTYQLTGNAVVDKIENVDVYVNSKPIREYTVVKSGITNVVMGNCDGMINKSARKAADEKADGVIIHLENYRYEAIKYK